MLCEIDLDQLDATATPTRTVTGDWNAPGLRLQPGHATADIALADGTLLILRGRARDGDTPLTAAQLAARHARAGAAFLDSLRGSFALALIDCTTARVAAMRISGSSARIVERMDMIFPLARPRGG